MKNFGFFSTSSIFHLFIYLFIHSRTIDFSEPPFVVDVYETPEVRLRHPPGSQPPWRYVRNDGHEHGEELKPE